MQWRSPGGFTEAELTLYVPPDRPRDGGLVVIWNGRSPNVPALLLLAHLDVVEAKREDWAGIHGLNERISLNSLYRGRDYLFDLIKYFAG